MITGATGQVGSAFSELLPDATLVDRSMLDLADPQSIGPFIQDLKPGVVINCAAYTNVDGAEQDEATATAVNGTSVGELAIATGRLGIPFLSFSTDYVFNGESTTPYLESDPVDPINAYGRSKLVGERLAVGNNPDSLVVRTSWVVSGTHDNFVSTMLRLADEPDGLLRVVNDQRGCLTIADDLARSAFEALAAGAKGLLHIANGPEASWFDIAAFALKAADSPGSVTPCSTEEFPRPAQRPKNSVLGSERMTGLGLDPLPSWQESLVAVVAAQRSRLDL